MASHQVVDVQAAVAAAAPALLAKVAALALLSQRVLEERLRILAFQASALDTVVLALASREENQAQRRLQQSPLAYLLAHWQQVP